MKVEGLHSYKAIAFIRIRSNPKLISIETKTYSKLRNSLQKLQIFSEDLFSFRTQSENILSKKQVIKNG